MLLLLWNFFFFVFLSRCGYSVDCSLVYSLDALVAIIGFQLAHFLRRSAVWLEITSGPEGFNVGSQYVECSTF